MFEPLLVLAAGLVLFGLLFGPTASAPVTHRPPWRGLVRPPYPPAPRWRGFAFR